MVHFLEEDLIKDAQKRRADEAFLSLGLTIRIRDANWVLWHALLQSAA
jgi:hypothetical protein